MEIHFPPDIEAKLHALATETGRTAEEFVQDALAGYFEALAQVRLLGRRMMSPILRWR